MEFVVLGCTWGFGQGFCFCQVYGVSLHRFLPSLLGLSISLLLPLFFDERVCGSIRFLVFCGPWVAQVVFFGGLRSSEPRGYLGFMCLLCVCTFDELIQ